MGDSSTYKRKRFVLVCGMARSGTTLLQKILDAHCDGMVAAETWQLHTDVIFLEAHPGRFTYGMPLQRCIEIAGRRCRAYYDELDRFVAGEGENTYIGDKIPPLATMGPASQAVLASAGYIPTVVMAMRHPLDVFFSAWERWGEEMYSMFSPFMVQFLPDDTLEMKFARVWSCGFRSFKDVTCPKALVRYELLVSEPERVARELCQFLGVEFDSDMLTDAFREDTRIWGDPKFYKTGGVHDRSVGRWKNEDPEHVARVRDALRLISAQELELTGYELG